MHTQVDAGVGKVRNRRNLEGQKVGTPEVCQIMPWYLKVRSHFSRCRSSSLGMHISIVPNSLQELRETIQATIQKL